MLPPPFEVILHPTDLTPASDVAFVHALRITLAAKGSLRVLHAADGGPKTHMPSARHYLQRWGILAEGATPEEVFALGIEISKTQHHGRSPLQAIVHDAAHHEPELLVMATHTRHGLARWFQPSISETAARRTHLPTLFLPEHCSGFVDEHGKINLNRILIPIHPDIAPQRAIESAARLARLAESDVILRLFHVGPPEALPPPPAYTQAHWHWESHHRLGTIEAEINQEIKDFSPDIVVMTSAGRDTALDLIFGSTAEQLLHQAQCHFLIVPVS
jgi:nucleotide-binding universal stress UspA family protein